MVLKAEDAQQRLAAWRMPQEDGQRPRRGRKLFGPAMAKLSEQHARIVYGLHGLDENGETSKLHEYAVFHARVIQAGKELDRLSDKQRVALLTPFFPRMAADVNRAWMALRAAPYQAGYQIKAFRAPDIPSASVGRRTAWLTQLLALSASFQADVLTPAWLATWAAYLQDGYRTWQSEIGQLLAVAIDAGGKTSDEVFDILCQSVRNEHEIGGMGQHAITGLLLAARQDGWELIEKLLLAAQRQEGLRQAILEAVDLTHPQAYRRLLRLICDQELARFSAVTRAVNVWFGYAWDSVSVKVVNAAIERVLTLLDDAAARKQAVAGQDPELAYLALWATAFENASASMPLAGKLLQHKAPEMRFVALAHLRQLALPEANGSFAQAIDDSDLRVACTAIGLIGRPEFDGNQIDGEAESDGHFEGLERLFVRLPKEPRDLPPIVWPWTAQRVSRGMVVQPLISALDSRPPTRLLPYLSACNPWQRASIVQLFAGQKKWTPDARAAVVELAGDSSAHVRAAAFAALEKLALTPAEQSTLEGLLTRKTADLRRGVLALLLKLDDRRALAGADRLLMAKDAGQRMAGLELLRQLSESHRAADLCRERAMQYQERRGQRTKDELTHLEAILRAPQANAAAALSWDNALGLMDPAARTPVVPLPKRQTKLCTPATFALLQSLDDLVHEHRETTVAVGYQVKEQQPLGGVRWFPAVQRSEPIERQLGELPLRDVWERWCESRPKATRDRDGMELVRVMLYRAVASGWNGERWANWAAAKPSRRAIAEAVSPKNPPELRYPAVVDPLLGWLVFMKPPAGLLPFLLDGLETLCGLIPVGDIQALIPQPASPEEIANANRLWWEQEDDWRTSGAIQHWSDLTHGWLLRNSDQPAREPLERYWRVLRWLDEPIAGATRNRPMLSLLMAAYDAGLANRHDVADDLLGPPAPSRWRGLCFDTLSTFTARKLFRHEESFLLRHPEIAELVEEARTRILDLELARGDTPTAATIPAGNLRSLVGSGILIRLLWALGKTGFKTAHSYRTDVQQNRNNSLTHLVNITGPGPDDTPAHVAALLRTEVQQKSFPEERVLELAFLAPQWTKHVEAHFKWDGLGEGIYWFLAHMRFLWGSDLGDQAAEGAGIEEAQETPSAVEAETDANVAVGVSEAAPPPQKLSPWQRLILERTELTETERNDGAIDVGWFRRVHQQLGAARWQRLAQSARFASNSAQARKAQLIADVLLGRAKLDDLIGGIEKRYLKDNVRLLGLYPLPSGAKWSTELLRRFKVLQDYGRYARQLSGLTKPQALRALEIGFKNLASTAGYADALRLEWSLGADELRDLRRGPVSATVQGVTVTLALDDRSQPLITQSRGDKPLKTVPPDVRKTPAVAELVERAKDLKRQASRLRQSLEAAMCRGDVFTAAELKQLSQHALVAPLLERLVIVGEGVMGYPVRDGQALRDFAGRLEPVKKNETLRIAHPHDLFAAGQWDQWQRECFQTERVQPFKQVFRELYVATAQERQDGVRSQRFAGQQVQPRQAHALWGQRGWQTGDDVWKTFHDVGISALVSFNHGVTTPLEVEGLTLDAVWFAGRQHDLLPLDKVPPRLFSEVMRDMDLVVSVAHRGGVDPEASASTVEMRRSLLRETCSLLNLDNVRLKEHHAFIDGELGQYSLHLGSGTVHKLPGGALCLVPVHAQHRGRLFLPFADDDPRTAEILSKALLLARDHEILDPAILSQLQA